MIYPKRHYVVLVISLQEDKFLQGNIEKSLYDKTCFLVKKINGIFEMND